MVDAHRRICERPKKPNCNWIVAAMTQEEGDECDLGGALLTNHNISAAHTNGKQKGIDALSLSRQWGIGVETAKWTLQATTQGEI